MDGENILYDTEKGAELISAWLDEEHTYIMNCLPAEVYKYNDLDYIYDQVTEYMMERVLPVEFADEATLQASGDILMTPNPKADAILEQLFSFSDAGPKLTISMAQIRNRELKSSIWNYVVQLTAGSDPRTYKMYVGLNSKLKAVRAKMMLNYRTKAEALARADIAKGKRNFRYTGPPAKPSSTSPKPTPANVVGN